MKRTPEMTVDLTGYDNPFDRARKSSLSHRRHGTHALLKSLGPATEAAHTAVEAAARRTAAYMIKWRARHFVLGPSELDNLSPGLSFKTPSAMIIELRHLAEIMPLQRWCGFGGEVPAINFHAAMLYARFLRAKTAQHLTKRRRPAA